MLSIEQLYIELGPEMLKFHPYSILTGETMIKFVIYILFVSLKVQDRTCDTKLPRSGFESGPRINFRSFLRSFFGRLDNMIIHFEFY
jgi:hypothetical protein